MASDAPARKLTRTEMLAHTVATIGFLIAAITGLGTEYIYGEVAGRCLSTCSVPVFSYSAWPRSPSSGPTAHASVLTPV